MAVEIALFRGSRTRYREDEAEDRSTTVSGWFNGTGFVRLVSCTAQRHACVTCKMGASAKGRVVLATVNVYNRLGSL